MKVSKPQATTMSVPEMRELLGLHKTDSYWLIHKNVFETVMIAGQMRVVKESFERWYENQVHYRKVNGPEPGKKLRERSYTIDEAASILGIHKESFREMVCRQGIVTFTFGNQQRIERKVFDSWYAGQSHYRNARDRATDQDLIDHSITVPELGRLLNVDRREAWKIVNHHKSELDLIRVAERPRITLESFERWFESQYEYTKVSEMSTEEQKQIEIRHQKKAILQMIRKGKKLLSIHETAICLGMDDNKVGRMANDEPDFGAKKIGKSWYISLDKLYEWITVHGEEQMCFME